VFRNPFIPVRRYVAFARHVAKAVLMRGRSPVAADTGQK